MIVRLFSIVVLLFAMSAKAQKIKFKKNRVLLDDKVLFDFKKTPFNDEYYFYEINNHSEVLYISLSDNGTSYDKSDDYTIIFFSSYNLRVKSKMIWFGLNSKPIIEKLVQEGVVLSDGSIKKEAMQKFSDKYNNT